MNRDLLCHFSVNLKVVPIFKEKQEDRVKLSTIERKYDLRLLE